MAALHMLVNGDHEEEHVKSARNMISTLSTSPQAFLQPDHNLHAAAISAVTQLLDPLADTVSRAQENRRDKHRRKRKRVEYQAGGEEPILQLRQVYTKGFKVNQIWEQARRVLDAAGQEIEHGIQNADTAVGCADLANRSPNSNLRPNNNLKQVHFQPDDIGSIPSERGSVAEEALGSEDVSVSDGKDGQGIEQPRDDSFELEDIEDESLKNGYGHSPDEDAQETFVTDPNGLNDGFFSINQFNKQSQFLEQRDALGQDDGAASDEEDVDWSVDPSSSGPTQTAASKRISDEGHSDVESSRDSQSEDDGPKFGDVDLDALSDEDAYAEGMPDVEDAMPGLDNTNDIKYADFFEPPPKPTAKSNKRRPLPKTQPEASAGTSSDLEADMQRAMSDVRRDLFDEEEELSESEEESEGQDTVARRNLSTHEKQRAKIAKEIVRLEAANVSKRDWTLSGEARAADRPMNSLIEEDLEFERTGKPVPVVTAEVSEEIEDLIKRRILAKDFDEVLRRRPDAVGAASEMRRGRVDLDDGRPQQSLADIYESEHLSRMDPNYKDPRSEKLKREHAEIDRLWRDVSAKLDTLSNLNFKPKRPEASVNVITDAPTITMEDAQPAATGLGGDSSRLAPQEVYNPSHDARVNKAEEVIRKGGGTVAREEMTREEKLRRRRREKERRKKGRAESEVGQRGRGGKAEEKQDILKELRRGGVKVIRQKGDVRDVEGKILKDGIGKAKGAEGMKGAMLKL